jgi:hypothetical protein
MAVIFMDPMDQYASDSDLQAGGWILDVSSQITPQTSGGRFGGGCVLVQYITGPARAVTISGSTLIIQCAFKHSALTYATNKECVTIYNNSGADKCASLKVTTGGAITAHNAAGATVGTSSTGVVKENIWQYLEVKFVVSDAAGSITVKVNETQVINATSIDTKPGAATDIDKVKFQGAVAGAAQGIYYDDIVFIDDGGVGPTDFIGDCRISYLQPIADDAQADWSLSAGLDGYALIDDTLPGANDGDSTYIYSNTAAEKSLFEIENLSGTPANIYAVAINAELKKTDGGSRTMRVYMDSNGTTDNGDTWSIGTDYEVWRHIWALNPDTATSWVAASVNALKIGVDLVS